MTVLLAQADTTPPNTPAPVVLPPVVVPAPQVTVQLPDRQTVDLANTKALTVDVKGPELSSPEIWVPATASVLVAAIGAIVTYVALSRNTERQVAASSAATDKQLAQSQKASEAQIEQARLANAAQIASAAKEAHLERLTNAQTVLFAQLIDAISALSDSTLAFGRRSDFLVAADLLRTPLNDIRNVVNKLKLWASGSTLEIANDLHQRCVDFYENCAERSRPLMVLNNKVNEADKRVEAALVLQQEAAKAYADSPKRSPIDDYLTPHRELRGENPIVTLGKASRAHEARQAEAGQALLEAVSESHEYYAWQKEEFLNINTGLAVLLDNVRSEMQIVDDGMVFGQLLRAPGYTGREAAAKAAEDES